MVESSPGCHSSLCLVGVNLFFLLVLDVVLLDHLGNHFDVPSDVPLVNLHFELVVCKLHLGHVKGIVSGDLLELHHQLFMFLILHQG